MTMEDCKDENSRKRARDESDVDTAESKLVRLDSVSSTITSSGSDQGEPDPDNSLVASPDAKQIILQDDLLNILDDSDPVNEPDPAIQDLDSVIKSFEEEILVPAPPPAPEFTSDSGESKPVLGYLLEASDDELGLPPSFSSGDEQKLGAVDFEPSGTGTGLLELGFGEMNMIGFEDQIPSYDSFEFGLGGISDNNYNCNDANYSYNCGNDFVALGGLFDFTDESRSREPADVPDFTWRQESLSAS